MPTLRATGRRRCWPAGAEVVVARPRRLADASRSATWSSGRSRRARAQRDHHRGARAGPGRHTGGTYLKLERKIGDYATAAVAAQVTMANGTIGQAGIAPHGRRRRATSERRRPSSLAGRQGADRRAHRRGGQARRRGAPTRTADDRGSVEYKRSVIRVFTERGADRIHPSGEGRRAVSIEATPAARPVNVTRQRRGALSATVEPRPAARPLHPRVARADRDPHRLRHHQLRRLHRPASTASR